MPFSVEEFAKDRNDDPSSSRTSERTLRSVSLSEEEYSKDSKSGSPSGVINSIVSLGKTQIRGVSNLLQCKNTSQYEHLMSVLWHSESHTEDRGEQFHPSDEEVCGSKVCEAIAKVSHVCKNRDEEISPSSTCILYPRMSVDRTA